MADDATADMHHSLATADDDDKYMPKYDWCHGEEEANQKKTIIFTSDLKFEYP